MHLLGITAAGRKRRDGACTPQHRRARTLRAIVRSACAAVLATTLVALGGCSENGAVGKTVNPSGSQSQTSGPAYERPELALSPFDQAAAGGENGVSIDASNLAKGYVAVSATASTRLKFRLKVRKRSIISICPATARPSRALSFKAAARTRSPSGKTLPDNGIRSCTRSPTSL